MWEGHEMCFRVFVLDKALPLIEERFGLCVLY